MVVAAPAGTQSACREPEVWVAKGSGPFRTEGPRIAVEPTARASAAVAPGLYKDHISAQHPFIEIHKDGGLARVCVPQPLAASRIRKPVPRGRVSEFSAASRRRLRRTIASTDLTKLSLFVHLTYPREFNPDSDVYKAHLDNFSRRMERAYPEAGFIWKLEFQKRGAPHFHVFVWGIPDFENVGRWDADLKRKLDRSSCMFRIWLSETWYEIVGSGDLRHFRAGTRVERIASREKAMAYCSGYASKDDQTQPGNYVGRYWGACLRKNIPWAPVVHVELTDAEAKVARRTLRRYTLASMRQGFLRKRARGIPVGKPRLRNNSNIIAYLDGNFWLRRLKQLLV